MNTKFFRRCLFLSIFFLFGLFILIPHSAFALTNIANCTDLQNINNNLAEDYQLTGIIDCTGVPNFNIIGTSSAPFTGTFDGQGFAVNGVTISGSAGYEAPFAYLGATGIIEEVGFTNINIDSTKTGFAYVGGLVARNYGTIQHSYTTGNVDSTGWYVGGLVGANEGGTIYQSYSTVNVASNAPRLGGLVGENDRGIISRSFSTGNVTGTSNQVGGLVGIQLHDDGSGTASISDSFSSGNVTGGVAVGGFVGYHGAGTITNSYTRSNTTAGDYGFTTGDGSVVSSYWDGEVSSADATSQALGTEKTTAEMKTLSTFAGWDFATIWGFNPSENDGYPFLRFQGFTIDTTPPTITSVSSDKVNGTYSTGDIIDIDVTFSEGVTSTGNVTVYLALNSGLRACTFTITNSSTGTCDYTVQAGDAALDLNNFSSLSGVIADASGNILDDFIPATSLAQNKDLAIVTPEPGIADLAPPSYAAVDASLIITFDEIVDAGVGVITIKKTNDDSTVETINAAGGQVTGSGTTTITINPTSDFEEKTSYYVQVSADAFYDIDLNNFIGISDTTTWNFTTIDATDPTVLSLSPADDVTEVSTASNLVMDFDEIVNVGFGDITIKKTSDNTTVATIDVVDGQVSGGGTDTITINPSLDLDTDTEYYVLIDTTAFYDASGNSFAGITSTTTWTFTTVDTIDPMVVSFSPIDDAIDVATDVAGILGSGLLITFNEPVVWEGAVDSVKLYLASDDSLVFAQAGGTGSGSEYLRLQFPFDFEAETEYYLTIDNDSIADLSGNLFAGITSPTIWSFTTAVPVSRSSRSGSSTLQSRAIAKEKFAAYHGTTSTISPSDSTPAINTCSAELILTQNLRAPSRNGVYNSYTGGIVKEINILQAHLNRLGFNPGPIDGIAGPLTDGAIKRMQESLGVQADGFVGPITRDAINKSCK